MLRYYRSLLAGLTGPILVGPSLVSTGLVCASLILTGPAAAQSSFVAPDGLSRYPGVTVWCPNGSGVAPCSFGGGSNNGAVSLTLGGTPVAASHPLPVQDALLEGLINAGALRVGGTVSLSGPAAVSQSGAWQVALTGALPAGGNALGSVAISNFPATQVVNGTVSVASLPALPAGTNAIGNVSVSNFPATQAISGSVAVSALPALPAGGNAIGSVSVNNLPATQPVSGSVSVSSLPALPVGTNAIGSVSVNNFPATQPVSGAVAVSTLPALPAGGNAIGSVSVSNFPASQPISGSVSVSSLPALPTGANAIGSVSVSNLPATQPISASALPLPVGAATDADLVAPYTPVAPAAASATKALLVGCQAATSLPSFSAGQQGAVPCDTSGRLYVVTVPSANNVPSYLQAVTSGGATTFSGANSAASCMATSLKSSTGMVFSYSVSNTNSSGVWFRLFAGASAPTCGSGTPVKRIFLPAGGTVSLSSDLGWVFTSGIGFDVTSGSGADTDATTIATANSVLVNIDYK